MHEFPIGLLGASGYAGRELTALLARHPAARLVFATADARRGERVHADGRALTLVAAEDAPLHRAALVFCALPHGAAAPWVERAHAAGARVVDLSADLRPGGAASTSLAAPYGLTEITRERVRGAQIVANPGCYATAVLLALIPLLARGLVGEGTIVVHAASGATGAGSAPRPELMFADVAEDVRAYAVGNEHRHLAEMRALLDAYACPADLVFTPHLVPVRRGILATLAVPLRAPLPDPLAPWRAHYAGEPFVEVTPDVPALRDVVHRNVVRIGAAPAAGVRRPTLTVIAALDNLLKGAAGQALQNGNLLLGLDETTGLPA